MSRNIKEYLGVFVRGMAMGAADVVPGVSGGTIAFITGIYEELIDSLKSCDHHALKCLVSKGIPATWAHINGSFLVAVFGGIFVSILSLAKLVTFALESQPILVWSMFFGLIVASSVLLLKQLDGWSPHRIGALLVGIVLAVAIAKLKPAHLPETGVMMFGAGAVAICAMILPGISGSFLLLMMGLYSALLGALSTVNLALLLPFLAGCAAGLLCFSHVLSWLLHHYRFTTMAFLTGVLLGSLTVVWPWKKVVESVVNRHGEIVPLVQENITPIQYEALTSTDSLWPYSILICLVGVIVVFVIEKVADKTTN